jgi:hypothetical protein
MKNAKTAAPPAKKKNPTPDEEVIHGDNGSDLAIHIR